MAKKNNPFIPVRGPQATLADVVGSGPAAEEYVRRIFEKMGGMQVRIALYGETEFPDYILDELFEPELDPDGVGHPQPMVAYKGATHRELTAESRYGHNLWADSPMNWLEVQALLVRLRGWKPKNRD